MSNQEPQHHVCRNCLGQVDNIFHALVQCGISRQVSDLLLYWVRKLEPSANIFDIVGLQIQYKANTKEELAISWLKVLSSPFTIYGWLGAEVELIVFLYMQRCLQQG